MTLNRIFSTCTALLLLTSSASLSFGSDVTLVSTKVTDNLFMISGKGGNLGVFTGEDGTFLIDDQFAPLTDQIIETIKSVGGDTPKFLINTHYHGDHTGGNENFGDKGTLIFSHDNVRERLTTGSFIQEFDMKREPVSKSGLPVVTFSEDISFHLNGEDVRAIHVPHAHTDGDSFIVFNSANIIHAGDIFFNGFYPFIDVGHGGNLKGMISATDKILSYSDATTQIIPGHGPLANKEQLTAYKEMLLTVYERLSKLKASGKSVKEAIEVKPLADLEEEWGDGIFTGDRWIEIIYPGV
ncbi:MBL fold metallo-hydrolase [Desulfosediminicola flagellatus]|uniref:MBL fold metallo-hydrolase n=1 Tax=Desulfosediminicola flagellatus TaxID=2569541 RepID=UPI00142EC134|nr:MBL fold metallo-hydrolase [Desulfosediminicola flagellatus]